MRAQLYNFKVKRTLSMPISTTSTVQGIDEAELLKLISEAIASHQPTQEDAERIFENAERIHEEFQRRLEATIPSFDDKQRIYNL